MKFTKSGVVAGIVLVATLATSTPALASISIYREDRGRVYTIGSTNDYAAAYDNSCDGQDVAAQYYREASSSTLRTVWNQSGCDGTTISGEGSWIFQMRLREQYIAAEDYYSAWDYDYR